MGVISCSKVYFILEILFKKYTFNFAASYEPDSWFSSFRPLRLVFLQKICKCDAFICGTGLIPPKMSQLLVVLFIFAKIYHV